MSLAVLHSLRIKGLASTDAVAEAAGTSPAAVAPLLAQLADLSLVVHRSGRLAGWSLTAAGRERHARLLAAEMGSATSAERAAVEECFRRFLALDEPFKEICTDWQLRNRSTMRANDHTDVDYDAGVVDRLGMVHRQGMAITTDLAAARARFAPYSDRFSTAYDRLRTGDHRWLTTPLTGSYHDVWMELHEDLIVTLGLSRIGANPPSCT